MNAVSQPLPLLSPEDQTLLSRYLSLNEDLAALAREQAGQHDLLSLLRWLSRPDIAAYTTAFHAHQNHLHRQAIIAALRTALSSLTDPIEVRRAAATLLRALNPRPSSPARGGGGGAAVLRGVGGSVSTASTKPPHSENTTSAPEPSDNRRFSAGFDSPLSTRPPLPPRSPHSTDRPPGPTSNQSHTSCSSYQSYSPSAPATAATPPPTSPLTSSPLPAPLDHSSTLAQALALLGLPTDLEALDRLDDEEDDAADDAELDAYADGEDDYDEDDQDDFEEDPPPHPTNSS